MSEPSLAAYVARKRRELEFLAAQLGTALPPLEGHTRVLAEKRSVMQQIHRAAIERLGASETRPKGQGEVRFGELSCSWTYQRFDLGVRSESRYLEALRGQASPRMDLESWHVSCGMAALNSALAAIECVFRPVPSLVMRSDCYFETLGLASTFFPGLGVDVVRSADELVERVARGPSVVFMDSVGIDCHAALTPELDLSQVACVVVDSTCYSAATLDLSELFGRCADHGVPVLIARSQQKLDTLGVEYGRAGSLVLAQPKASRQSERDAQLARTLAAHVRRSGAQALAGNIFPFDGSPVFVELNELRVRRIQQNNAHFVEALRAALPAHVAVQRFHHDLFSLVSWPSFAVPTEALTALAADLERSGLPVWHAGSFGLDFVQFDSFLNAELERVIRFAISDICGEHLSTLLDEVTRWVLRHAGG